jgi:hypothetical protein
MCDYSLHHVKARPAKVGDKLTARDFGLGTRGFAASEDASVASRRSGIPGRRDHTSDLSDGRSAGHRPPATGDRRVKASATTDLCFASAMSQ